MKKVALSLIVLSMAGFTYAGAGCCGTKKAADGEAKREASTCTKADGTKCTKSAESCKESCSIEKADKAEKTEKKD